MLIHVDWILLDTSSAKSICSTTFPLLSSCCQAALICRLHDGEGCGDLQPSIHILPGTLLEGFPLSVLDDPAKDYHQY